jgi:serine protease Do
MKMLQFRTAHRLCAVNVMATVGFLGVCLALCCDTAVAQTRDEMVRADRKKVTEDGFWIYNDLDEAFRQARETGKPILVVLRCIPCHECVKLDDDLVDQDPVIRPLLDQFVCVRQVSTNGLDLSLFQYDTDQSFAVFMLNADGTVYGRFGTRSHRTEWFGDVSLEGLAAALQGALELHTDYPANRDQLQGKRGRAPEVPSPEQYPSLKDRFTDRLNYQGDVAKSCIHCHQIGDAQREFYWAQRQAIPTDVLFPFPHPKSIGLILDPESRATVQELEAGSLAAASGLVVGDQIRSMSGQPLLSIADVQWALHQASDTGDRIAVVVEREGKEVSLELLLPEGWRQRGDLSWRATSWTLRRMVTGGMVLEAVDEDIRRKASLPEDTMALRVTYLGQYGPHAAAKQAGLQADDVVIAFDGQDQLMTETAVFDYAVRHRTSGDRVEVVVLRGDQQRTFSLPMQP